MKVLVGSWPDSDSCLILPSNVVMVFERDEKPTLATGRDRSRTDDPFLNSFTFARDHRWHESGRRT
jgi:hypothetical protein